MADRPRDTNGKFLPAEKAAPPTTISEPFKDQRQRAIEEAEKRERETKDTNKESVAGLEALANDLLGKKPEEKKVEDDAEAKAKAAAKAKAKPAAAKPKPAAERQVSAPQLTAKEIAEATASAVANVLKPKEEKTDEKKDAPKLDENLTDADKETFSVLQEMEALYPTQYKSGALTGKFVEGVKKLHEYATQWEKDNPGQEFDIEDPTHKEFLEKNDVPWDDTLFKKAEKSLLLKEATRLAKEETQKEFGPKLSKLDEIEKEKANQKRLAESQGVVRAAQVAGLRDYWGKVDEQFKDLVSPDGKPDDAAFTQLMKDEPETHLVAMATSHRLNAEVMAARQLFAVSDKEAPLVSFDPKNPVHQTINQVADKIEAELAKLPADQTTDENGRQFISAVDPAYLKMSPEQKRNYWTVGFDDVQAGLAAQRAADAKDALAVIERGTLTAAETIAMVKERPWLVDLIETGLKNREKRDKAAKTESELSRETQQLHKGQNGNRTNGFNFKPTSPGSFEGSRSAATSRASGKDKKNVKSDPAAAYLLS